MINSSIGGGLWQLVCVSVCLCVCVCLFLRNLGDSFISLLVELIAGKNVSPSVKNLWRFLKNVLVAEKLQCKALSIGRHLEISSLLLMSAENTEMLTFVSLKFCFLGFVHHINKLFISYLWSFIRKFISSEEIRVRADEERMPTHCLIIIKLGLFMLRFMRSK